MDKNNTLVRKKLMPMKWCLIIALPALLLTAGCIDQKTRYPAIQVTWVKVFKHTGAIQCEPQGDSINTMQETLNNAGISVDCTQKSHDGMMRPAMCGAGTSDINVFRIPENKLAQAKQLGFKPVTVLKGFQDTLCPKNP